jgi:hypothetical protein
VKGSADGVGGHLLQLTGDDRREHWAASRLHGLDFRVGTLAVIGRCLSRDGVVPTALARNWASSWALLNRAC